jgi:hypothetical protein
MRLIKILLLALASLLTIASVGNAIPGGTESARLETLYDGTALNNGESLLVDLYHDCECLGGTSGEASDYVIFQFSVTFDSSMLSYNPDNSFPNDPTGNPQPGISDPGIIIFGKQGKATGLVILGGTPADTYYTAKGGPHTLLSPGRILIFYTSKGLLTGTGTGQGGEYFVGGLSFDAASASAGSSDIVVEYLPDDLIEYSNGVQLDSANFNASGDVTVNVVPEPAAAGASLAVLLTLYGVHARRRNS